MAYGRELILAVIVTIYGVGISYADPSVVSINMVPKYFYPEVTQSVTLSCLMTSPAEGEEQPTVVAMRIKRSGSSLQKNGEGGTNETSTDEDKKMTEAKHSIKTPEILLAGVSFSGKAVLHVGEESAIKKRLKVEGSMAERRLVLTIQRPRWEDAGTYICYASVLSQGYQFVDYTASANLTVLGEKGSSALLLAKQQVLETHQQHLQQSTVVLQEELRHLHNAQQNLLDKLRILEEKNHNLSSQVQILLKSTSSSPSPSSPSSQHSPSTSGTSSRARPSPESQLEMVQVKSKLDHLQNDVVPNLNTKIDALDAKISGSVLDQISSIRQRLRAVESGKSSGGVRVPSSKSEGEGGNLEVLEKLPQVLERLDSLEQRVVGEISQKVTRLENVEVKNVRERLDSLELHRVKEMESRIQGVEAVSESNGKLLGKVESEMKDLLESLENMKTECYVCGNITESQTCSLQDVREKRTEKCPLESGFCMNDVIQDGHSKRQVYKRCVSQEVCVQLTRDSNKRCADFSFMTLGPLTCHFCCSYSKCNFQVKPDDLYKA